VDDSGELATQLPTDIDNAGSGAPAHHIGNVWGAVAGQLPTQRGLQSMQKVGPTRGPIGITKMITNGHCQLSSNSLISAGRFAQRSEVLWVKIGNSSFNFRSTAVHDCACASSHRNAS
jgi:hypothetical protein